MEHPGLELSTQYGMPAGQPVAKPVAPQHWPLQELLFLHYIYPDMRHYEPIKEKLIHPLRNMSSCALSTLISLVFKHIILKASFKVSKNTKL